MEQDSLTSYFNKNLSPANDEDLAKIEQATAALLIEMIRIDDDILEMEQESLVKSLQQFFELGEDETQEIIQLAESKLDQTSDVKQFTNLIDSNFSYENKKSIIKLLWQIAYADKQLHRDEAYFVREIAKQIHVSDEDVFEIRDRVMPE